MTKYIISTLLIIIVLLLAHAKLQSYRMDKLKDKVAQHPTDVFEKVQDERKSNYEKAIDRNISLDGNTTYWVQ